MNDILTAKQYQREIMDYLRSVNGYTASADNIIIVTDRKKGYKGISALVAFSLSYFMGRTTKSDVRADLCSRMVNPLLKDFIRDLDKELTNLEWELPFDDVALLLNLSDVMNEYRSEFNRNFSHR